MLKKLFDYLRLDTNEKIKYKQAHNTSAKEIYESARPEYIIESLVGIEEISRRFGFSSYSTFYKYAKQGLFGKPIKKIGKRIFYSNKQVNELLRKNAYNIPLTYITEVLDDYYISEVWFCRLFSNKFIGRFDGKRVVSIVDCAKILKELRKRKDIIENWRTFSDLSNDLEGRLRPDSLSRYYRSEIENGKLPVVQTQRTKKGEGGRTYHIPIEHYQRILEEQKARFSGLTVKQITQLFGINGASIRERIRFAKQKGIIKPSRTPTRGHGGYILTMEQARLITTTEMLGLSRNRPIDIARKNFITNRRITASNIDSINSISIQKSIEDKLITLARKGDIPASTLLLKLYEPLFLDEGEKYRNGAKREERIDFLRTAFFELLIEGDCGTSREETRMKLRKKLEERIREEKPLWLSLDKEYFNKENTYTLKDLLAERDIS